MSEDEKLEQAAVLLRQHGHKQTVAALLDALKELYGKGMNRQKVNRWHKAHPQSAPHFPTAA